MTDFKLSVCPQRGPGYVQVESQEFSVLAVEAQWRIMRVGVSAANLGLAGWQIAPFTHTLSKVGSNQFLLGPEIVSNLVPGTNYRVSILQSGQDDMEFVLSWRGIPSYRSGADSTIFQSQAKSLADEKRGSKDEPETSSSRNHVEPIDELFLPHKTPQQPVLARLQEPGSTSTPPVIQYPTLTQTAAPVVSRPVVERKHIRCPNEACRQQILSSFTQCPWCTMELRALGKC